MGPVAVEREMTMTEEPRCVAELLNSTWKELETANSALRKISYVLTGSVEQENRSMPVPNNMAEEVRRLEATSAALRAKAEDLARFIQG